MAIFVDHRVQAPYPGHTRDIQWHKTQGLLAVGSFNETTGAAVTVYQEEVSLFSAHSLSGHSVHNFAVLKLWVAW